MLALKNGRLFQASDRLPNLKSPSILMVTEISVKKFGPFGVWPPRRRAWKRPPKPTVTTTLKPSYAAILTILIGTADRLVGTCTVIELSLKRGPNESLAKVWRSASRWAAMAQRRSKRHLSFFNCLAEFFAGVCCG